jgi:hypothetical protein
MRALSPKEKTLMAWFEICDRATYSTLNAKDMEEIARLLDLDCPPKFARNFLADLIRGDDTTKLVPKKNGRVARKDQTIIRKFEVWRKIKAAMAAGKTKTEAIEAVMPGRREQGFAAFKKGEHFAIVFAETCAKFPWFLDWGTDERELPLTEWVRIRKPKDGGAH